MRATYTLLPFAACDAKPPLAKRLICLLATVMIGHLKYVCCNLRRVRRGLNRARLISTEHSRTMDTRWSCIIARSRGGISSTSSSSTGCSTWCSSQTSGKQQQRRGDSHDFITLLCHIRLNLACEPNGLYPIMGPSKCPGCRAERGL